MNCAAQEPKGKPRVGCMERREESVLVPSFGLDPQLTYVRTILRVKVPDFPCVALYERARSK